MRRAGLLAVAGGVFCTLTACPATGADDPKELRDTVIKASSAKEKAEAYRQLFEKVGRAGLADLMKDEDTGIALQVAWESHKKAIKRPKPIQLRTDDIYDPAELKKFVAFLKDRTKAPVPDWWAKAIVDVDLFPRQHHAFSEPEKADRPKLRKAKAGGVVPEGAELEEKGGNLVYTTSGRAVEFPKAAFEDVFGADCFAGLVGEKRSVIAAYTVASGFRFELAGFEGKGGKPAWKSAVWAAGRRILAGRGYHWVELTQKGDTVFVFGAESHAMYVEAFDIATGKCLFRFCTCYWFNFSEKWGLK